MKGEKICGLENCRFHHDSTRVNDGDDDEMKRLQGESFVEAQS